MGLPCPQNCENKGLLFKALSLWHSATVAPKVVGLDQWDFLPRPIYTTYLLGADGMLRRVICTVSHRTIYEGGDRVNGAQQGA